MKKFAALLLALVMVLSLAACGEKNPPAGSASASGSTGGDEAKVYNVSTSSTATWATSPSLTPPRPAWLS